MSNKKGKIAEVIDHLLHPDHSRADKEQSEVLGHGESVKKNDEPASDKQHQKQLGDAQKHLSSHSKFSKFSK